MTKEDKMEEGLAAFLESKRDSFEPAPGFEDRVMAAIPRGMGSARQVAAAARHADRNPPAVMGAAWLHRLRRFLPDPGRPAFWVPACLALAAGVFLSVRPPVGTADGDSEALQEGIRIKGDNFAFAALVQEAEGYRKIEGEAPLRAGDRIQALYWLTESAEMELLSLDARGGVECYSCGNASATYGPGAGQPLPFGIELDGAPGAELFILAASPRRIPADRLEALLARAWQDAGGDLGKAAESLRQSGGVARFRTLMVRKGGRP